MTNEEKTKMQKELKDTIRLWNQAEEFGQVRVADSLMRKIKRLEAQLYPKEV